MLAAHEVPYYITAGMTEDGYHHLTDLANLYKDIDTAKDQAPTDFRFTPAACAAFTDQAAAVAATRLGQACME